ncbi:hypothetical protein Droror1_Dr00016392 [Drosera rotundifolia]
MESDSTITAILADLENNPHSPISPQTLKTLQTLIDQITATDDQDEITTFWDEISAKGVPLTRLINPIVGAMDSGQTQLGILGSKLYLSLILCDGSPRLSIFNPVGFGSLLRVICRYLKNKEVGRGRDSGERRDSGLGRGRGRGKGKGNMRRVSGGLEEEEEEEGGGVIEFDISLFFDVMERLELVLDLVHLCRFPDSLKSLVHTVAEIPVLGMERCGGGSVQYKRLCEICSGILAKVIRPEHGEVESTIAEVLKSLLPLIFLVKSQARTFALGFVTRQLIILAKGLDAVNKGMVNIPRYLAQKAPERSEARASAVESIIEIVKLMEFEDQLGFVDYVLKMTEGKTNLRLLAVDLIPMLIISVNNPSDMDLDEEVVDSWKVRCMGALIKRCSDAVAGIRARALSNLSQLVSNMSSNARDRSVLKRAMEFEYGKSGNTDQGLNDLIRKRCMDEKAVVRKAALLLITKLMSVGDGFDGEVLKMMGMACSDPLVSIRKAAISALSEAFKSFSNRSVITEWLHSVPRLITDSETSIQEECENLFLELVLDRVFRAGTGQLSNRPVICSSYFNQDALDKELETRYPNGVLVVLKEVSNGEVAPWIKKICSSLGKKKKLKHRVATALQDMIRTSESIWLNHSMPINKWTAPHGTWLLLSEVSLFLPQAVDWEFLLHHWQLLDNAGQARESVSRHQEHRNKGVDSMGLDSIAWANDRVLLLQTISRVSVELPPEPAADLASNLLKRLEECDMHLTEVNAHVQALKMLCKRKALNPEEGETLVRRWVDMLLAKALNITQQYLSEDPDANSSSVFATPVTSGCKTSRRTAPISKSQSRAITAVYTIGSTVIVCPSTDLKDIVPVLYSIITSGSQESRSNNITGSTFSIKEKCPSLYIQAWLTMGKICLADGNLAKRYIPLFVQELEKSDCAALRNNIIVTMADFCVRYTALIDCYIAKITKCLRDPCELVRRQTFTLLSRLLQMDYVKWRGVLFLRFLLSLVDESEKIRQLADFLFGTILKAKAPLLAYNSFVEAVFVLNDCHSHMGHSSSQSSQVENKLFSIRGNDDQSRSKRMHIYVSLLKQMAPEHLLATFAKVCAEILAAASDGMLTIEDHTGQAVLQDAFQILMSKEIKIPTSRGGASDGGDADEEGGDGAGTPAATDAARGRFITQAVKKSLIQNTIPIFIELKRLLESKNNPLIGSLMECLRVLLKDYKNEIEDFLVADKQLQKELLYDMQKYEAAKARSTAATEATAAAALNRQASYMSPGVCPSAAVPGVDGPNVPKKKHNDPRVVSAMADEAAASKARSVLREVNLGISTPPLSSMSVPRLKSSRRIAAQPAATGDVVCSNILEYLRRRQSFGSEDDD